MAPPETASWRRTDGLTALFAGLLAGCAARPSTDPDGSTSTSSDSTPSTSTPTDPFIESTIATTEFCPGGCCGGCSCDYAHRAALIPLAEYAMYFAETTSTSDTTTTSSTGTSTSSTGTTLADTSTGTTTIDTSIDTSTSSTGTTLADSSTGTTLADSSTSSTGTTLTDSSTSSTGTTLADSSTSSTGTSTTGDAPDFDGTELTPGLCIALCELYADAFDWELTCTFAGITPDDQVQLNCTWITGCDGRRHACLRSTGDRPGPDPLLAWLARAAHDEAGSVHAFLALHRELAAHRAPPHLLRRLRRAAADERHHARIVDRLIQARNGRWPRPAVRPHPRRSLLAIALENAAEGCVRETWSALSAAHQARHAEDPQIRRSMRRIAADEARHAELAWALDAWLRARLGPDACALVDAARTAAARQLRAGLHARRLPRSVRRTAGVPDAPTAAILVAGLAAALWPA